MSQLKRSGLTWLIAALLGTCAMLAAGQEDTAQASLEEQTRQVQASLKRLSQQVTNLRRMTTQADRALLQQGQTIQKQVTDLEQAQTKLQAQLLALQSESQQQLDHLQTKNRKLSQALWSLAGLVILMLISLVGMWRTRGSARSESATPSPAQPSAPASAPTPSTSSNTPLTSIPAVSVVAAVLAEPAPQTSPPIASPSTDPELLRAPDLSTWIAADLDNTAQALAQARDGFMQPVQIDN